MVGMTGHVAMFGCAWLGPPSTNLPPSASTSGILYLGVEVPCPEALRVEAVEIRWLRWSKRGIPCESHLRVAAVAPVPAVRGATPLRAAAWPAVLRTFS